MVGNQYTTTWTGSLDNWGDWQIIYNGTSTNSRRFVYSSALTSENTHLISAMNFGTLPTGSALCVYGSSTAQTCRYYVTGNTGYYNEAGHWVFPGVQARHDFNGDGKPDCSTGSVTRGDSGGPVYYGNATGVTGYALVSGGASPCSNSTSDRPVTREFRFAPMRGIKGFDPNAIIGGFLR